MRSHHKWLSRVERALTLLTGLIGLAIGVIVIWLFLSSCGEIPEVALKKGNVLTYGISSEMQQAGVTGNIGHCLALWGEAVNLQIVRGKDKIVRFKGIVVELAPGGIPAYGATAITTEYIPGVGDEYLKQALIYLDAAVPGSGWETFVICHELGHVLGITGHPSSSPLMQGPNVGFWDGAIDPIATAIARERIRDGWLSRGTLQ